MENKEIRPLQSELIVSTESIIPNARAFVRSLNVLLKYTRLYGLDHLRSAGQFEVSWNELEQAVRAAGQGGLLLGASGSQLLLDGVPLESTQAERSFADLLNAAGVASISFLPSVERDEFANLIKAFLESSGPKAGPLTDRLRLYFGDDDRAGIRVNEIRFVAEDAGFSEARVAAQLTARTLGADAEMVQDWFRSPEKMIQLIAAAEGAHGGSGGSGSGQGAGGQGNGGGNGSAYSGGLGISTGGGTGTGPGLGTGGGISGGTLNVDPKDLPQLGEAEMHSLLRLLAQFGEAAHTGTKGGPSPDQVAWQAKLAALPQNAQVTLRQALATVAAKTPSAKVDETVLLRLAEDLAIRFALDRFQRGEVRVNAVRQMLDKMGHELDTLRKLLKAREEKMASAGISVESHADVLDRQFWAAVPESGKRAVLTSSGGVVHSAAKRAAICGRASRARRSRMPRETCC